VGRHHPLWLAGPGWQSARVAPVALWHVVAPAAAAHQAVLLSWGTHTGQWMQVNEHAVPVLPLDCLLHLLPAAVYLSLNGWHERACAPFS